MLSKFFSSPPRPEYLRSPNTPSWRGAQLKRRDSFNFKWIMLTTSIVFLDLAFVIVAFLKENLLIS
jgi:hypothetical protein